MTDILAAFARALGSLTHPVMFWHLAWPTLAAALAWGVLGAIFWGSAAAALAGLLGSLPWLQDIEWASGVSFAMLGAVHVLMVLVLVPLVYATAVFLASAIAVPLMLERVAAREYADLERRRGGSLAGSLRNASFALAVWALGSIVTAPLWLVPGMGLLLSLALSAWLNARTYRYDALMQHADAHEMHAIFERERGRLLLAGLGGGALAYLPVIHLLAPAYAGLVFIHFGLTALRRMRGATQAIRA